MNRNVRFLLIALATTAAFLLPFVIYFSATYPQAGYALDQQREHILRLQGRATLLHADAARIDKIRKELPPMEAELARQRIVLPAQPSAAAFKSDLDPIVSRNGGKLVQLLAQKPFMVAEALSVQRFRVEVEGDRNALPAIVRDLESSPVLTTVEGATIKPIDEKRSKLSLIADRYGVVERYGIIEN